MGDGYDPHNGYFSTGERAGSLSRTSVSAYTVAPPLTSYPTSTSIKEWGVPPEYLQKDIKSSQPQPGGYGYADIGGVTIYPEPVMGGVTSGVSAKGYTSPSEDPLVNQRREISVGMGATEIGHERARNAEGIPIPAPGSNILFVEGLPTDCTRREVGHLFRPFIGYKDIRVIHKEPRRIGDKATVLCFVEFVDANCAQTAMVALQGYKFDDKKPDSPALKIQFALFPFRLRSNHDER